MPSSLKSLIVAVAGFAMVMMTIAAFAPKLGLGERESFLLYERIGLTRAGLLNIGVILLVLTASILAATSTNVHVRAVRSTMAHVWRRNRLAFICFVLASPLLFAAPGHRSLILADWPRVFSGDELHYLVSINSLIADGDFDLSNNYASVHAGSDQAGKSARGRALDHHTVWFERGVPRTWASTYEMDPQRWDRDEQGHPVPRLREGQEPPAPNTPEYSTHPPGLGLLLAPVLVLFRGTTFIEPLAIACATLAVIFAVFQYVTLLRRYCTDDRIIYFSALVTFLGTPAWNYARSLFTEPFLLCCAISAYSIALRGRSPMIAGLFLGIGLLMKPPFAVLLLPLVGMYLAARDFRSAVLLVSPVAVAFAAYLGLNNHMFGSPFAVAQGWVPGSLIIGAIGSLFSPQYGYVLIAPAILAAFAAWPAFIRSHRRDSLVLACGVLVHFCLFASYGSWAGATSYGARYVIQFCFSSRSSRLYSSHWSCFHRPGCGALKRHGQ